MSHLRLLHEFSDTLFPVSIYFPYIDSYDTVLCERAKKGLVDKLMFAQVDDYKIIDEVKGVSLLLKTEDDCYRFEQACEPDKPRTVRFKFDDKSTNRETDRFSKSIKKRIKIHGLAEEVTIRRDNTKGQKAVYLDFQNTASFIRFIKHISPEV